MHSLFSNYHSKRRDEFERPGLPYVAILAIALGIGANAAILAVLHEILLNPLPTLHVEQSATLNDSREIGDQTATRQDHPSLTTRESADRSARPQNICAVPGGSSRLTKRKAGAESRTLAARHRGARNREVLARYKAKGTSHGQLSKRHPFCASQSVAASRVHRNRPPDVGAGNRDQCGLVFRC